MTKPDTNLDETSAATLPKKKFRVRFEPMGITFKVDPAELPFGDTGEPGSLLDIALQANVDIEHSCGGFCSCATCHVIVRAGFESCNEASDEELDQLDNAPGVTAKSRLACQCIPTGEADLVVEVPEWNRNWAKEGP